MAQAQPAAHRGYLARSRHIPVEELYDQAQRKGKRLVLTGVRSVPTPYPPPPPSRPCVPTARADWQLCACTTNREVYSVSKLFDPALASQTRSVAWSRRKSCDYISNADDRAPHYSSLSRRSLPRRCSGLPGSAAAAEASAGGGNQCQHHWLCGTRCGQRSSGRVH